MCLDGKQTLTTNYSVDGFRQPIQKTVTDQDGAQRVWHYRYNPNGKLLQIKDPENNHYSYGYDPFGNLISVSENNTQTTKYHYNGLSWKISEESLPSGKKESFQYYPTGLLRVYQDKAGNKHEYAYTPFNDVSSITTKNPAGTIVNKETKEYHPGTSLVKSETNSNGADLADTSPDRRSISYTYDLYQRMNGFSTLNKNYGLRYTDSDDLVDELVYSDNHTVSYMYDAAGRISQVSSPLLQTVNYQYTVANTGETETTLFPNQFQMEQHRDSFGQVDSTQQRKNGVTTWAESNKYQFGNIVTKSQNGTLFDYQYDKIDRLKAESVPSGGKSYQYDQRGNRLTVKGGTETNKGMGSYTFDARNRLQTYTNNNETASYQYYPDGLRSTKIENGQTTNYVYLNGKIIEELDQSGNIKAQNIWGNQLLARKDFASTYIQRCLSPVEETKEYHPGTSLVKSETNSNGADLTETSANRRSISYTYDLYQRMNGFSTMNKNYGLRYTDSDDLVDELVYSDNHTVSYMYDAAGRISQVSSPLLQTVNYQYTVANTGETETTLFPNQFQMEQHRDSFGQVDSTQQRKNGVTTWAESNKYQFGNIVTKSQNGTLFDYQYHKIDRLKAESVPSGGKSYQYDQRGNRLTVKGGTDTNKGTGTYTFDARNRLQTYTNISNQTSAYQYYPDGLRSTKIENGQTTHYVYLNGKIIEELDQDGNIKAQNIWGNQLLARKDFASNEVGYYQHNSHGDVIGITDSTGNPINTYEYDSWGNILNKTEGMSNPFTYSGEVFDDKTGLYYLRARYYDPQVGRFISEDTYKGQVDNPLSLNRYTYVHNNPINNVDPTGYWCESKDGKWAHAGGCSDKSNYKNRDWSANDADHDKDFIKENGKVVGVYYYDTSNDGARELEGFEDATNWNPWGIEKTAGKWAITFAFAGFTKNVGKSLGQDAIKSQLKNLDISKWSQGSFNSIDDSVVYHFMKHGKSVDAADVAQYLRKAEGFATHLRGATTSRVSGSVEGVIRYKKNGNYIDIAPDGTIISFGKQ